MKEIMNNTKVNINTTFRGRRFQGLLGWKMGGRSYWLELASKWRYI